MTNILPNENLAERLRELTGWKEEFSLGTLLRKLPNDEKYRSDLVKFKDEWEAYLWGPTPFSSLGSTNLIVMARGIDKSPENAVCTLLIEMFEQGILKRED